MLAGAAGPTCSAILLAAGRGERFHGRTPKQLVRINGLTIVEHTINAFLRCSRVGSIYVVTNGRVREELEGSAVVGINDGRIRLVEGGVTRNQSTLLGLRAVADEHERPHRVLVHDAVRPFVALETIEECISSLDTFDAVDVAIPITGTIIATTDGKVVDAVEVRHRYRLGQTPQGFRLGSILDAYKIAERFQDLNCEDDCTVLLRYQPESRIAIIPGTPSNLKLTTLDELHLFQLLFAAGTLTFGTNPIDRT